MHMQVNEPRRDDQTRRVDGLLCRTGHGSDFDNAAILDQNVAGPIETLRGIDDVAACD